MVLTMRTDCDDGSWEETAFLLRSPENARRLREAVGRDHAGVPDVHKSIEELEELAGMGEGG